MTREDQLHLEPDPPGRRQVQKRDIETGEAAAQGGATLEGAEFTITSLNANPVIVDGENLRKRGNRPDACDG